MSRPVKSGLTYVNVKGRPLPRRLASPTNDVLFILAMPQGVLTGIKVAAAFAVSSCLGALVINFLGA